jgi:hypothetical protein
MNLKVKVRNLQLNAEALLKLLGGNEDDRERFWEILKGITTPAVASLVEQQIESIDQQVKLATQTVKNIEHNAKGLGGKAAEQVA